MRWRGTIVMLLVRLRGTQLDLMEKKLATHGNLLLFFFEFLQFSKNDYFVAIDEHKHKEAS